MSRLIKDRGVVRIERCLSALPSVTLPNHTTIFTGVYPSRHGVSGNEWFDRKLGAGEPLYRRTREYVKYGTDDDPGLGSSWSFGGIPIHDMDMSPKVRTIYEAFKEAYKKKYGDDKIPIFGDYNYDMVYVTAKAIEKGGYTADGIRKALPVVAKGYKGVTGDMKFQAGSGDPIKSAVILQIKGDKFVYHSNANP